MKRVLTSLLAAALTPLVLSTPALAHENPRCPQHRDAAIAAGWTDAQWERLDFIIWRESRCKPDAFNGRGRDRSYGLMQLNMKAHRKWVSPMVNGDFTRLFDPAVNFAVALELYSKAEDMFGCGWKPWITSKTRHWCS